MLDKIQNFFDRLQTLLDISGDCWMGLFTACIVFRTAYAALGHVPLNPSESAAYASAIAAFSYSNKGTPKS